MTQTTSLTPLPNKTRGRWKLLLVLLVCASPLIASYFTYYVIKPQTRTNYGYLIDPAAHPIPPLSTTTLDGRPVTLADFKGKWLMLKVGGSTCDTTCIEQMYAMRQLRSMQGKEMDRIERVWLITDQEPLETVLIRELDGMQMLRANRTQVAAWLPVAPEAPLDGAIWLVDPLGHLMMRFPAVPATMPETDKLAHYAKIKKDIAKLLKASAIG
ncbi:SCO family protein [Massilia sp. S19_KUP03_FR1]|uniref:SCO family protein n=1 Tax=Massilia sp. S19_KUP03_FR1 TaxID=3025503 RepID=UPI002FCD1882